MIDAVGVDSYNLCTTEDVAKTLQAERSDNEHLPCVIVGGVVHRKRAAARCDADRKRSLQDAELYVRPDESVSDL